MASSARCYYCAASIPEDRVPRYCDRHAAAIAANEAALTTKTPERVLLGEQSRGVEGFELDDASVTVVFSDGTEAVLTAVWHNDSTAGLYLRVENPNESGAG